MDNKEIYKKTIGFSLWRLLWDIIAFIAFAALTIIGIVIADKAANNWLIGLAIGAIIGGVASYIILHYIAFSYKAGQIAMMTRAVTDGKLPNDVIGEGKKIVKARFATVAAYYAATGAIKGIFSQLGNAITGLGRSVGGDAGGAVGSTISGVIQTIVDYLCDCCLGWVFYRKDVSAGRATCEGAVLFFKHGKTLAKNLGRVFGMGFLSLLIIGGVFTGIFYLIFMNFPDAFSQASQAIIESNANAPEWITSVTGLTVISSIFCGVVLWSMVHETFVKPFVLAGVLRNYIKSGMEESLSEKDFATLDSKSDKFRKLHESVK